MKLTKQQSKLHLQAMDLIHSDKRLSEDDKYFILENYQESAQNLNALAGAFFTPEGLARDFSIEVSGGHIVDLCAGIGRLSFACEHKAKSLTCVELNADYIEVGKRILPDANWVQSDALLFESSELFDVAISNPPFGNIGTSKFKGNYSGSSFEYKVIEAASKISKRGVFILPQMSSGFRYSGVQCFEKQPSTDLEKFSKQTGIDLEHGCGIDTSIYSKDWHGVSVICEVVLCDFEELHHEVALGQLDMWGEAV